MSVCNVEGLDIRRIRALGERKTNGERSRDAGPVLSPRTRATTLYKNGIGLLESLQFPAPT
ncbi:predicted protein [Sclerotinia sclerotiorum 1980 UF-70]|uniref:Uncharacterized protein n=1 Tax=Sclerotinia sclerotiorum (strain ATCC 18683 / 1980 / Ss-1) TaxID=665079 RepID=A7EAZ1_SCLS1|nr:predicted protein [Sclerotinia sclerotiorum 1980 UF-70]EDN99619.1 predicted protein [Sclerotinia sclerotiorum 1980 UF-70]